MPEDPYELVRALAADVLDSFEKLELLAALAAAAGPREVAALAAQARLDATDTAVALGELAGDGVVVLDGTGWRLAADGPWSTHARAVVALHRDDRIAVATILSEAALERMRRRARRAFADAFVIGRRRKKGEDDG